MLESAGLQQEAAAVRRLVFSPLFFFFPPVAKLNIPSESCVLSAAPFSACNCLLCAGVGSAQLTSVPDSLSVNGREGNNHFSHMCFDRQ